MGFFSYECKECKHSILSSYSTDPGINEWMKDTVVLDGESRIIGEYDGYGRVDGGDSYGDYDGAVWLHLACWEVAGKPEADHYDGGSPSAGDQGYFFGKEHDLIDPRIKDPIERERLLKDGVAAREKRWYDGRAMKVVDWIRSAEVFADDPDNHPWSDRFHFGKCRAEEADENGRYPVIQDKWYISDSWSEEDGGLGETKFQGKHAELLVHIDGLWANFLASPECAAYLVRAGEIQAEATKRYHAMLREEGRYEVTYRPSDLPADTIDGRKMGRSMYYVQDKLGYGIAFISEWPEEGELAGKTFTTDPDFDGTVSAEWEARIPLIRGMHRTVSRAATIACERFNAEWATAGFPTDKEWAPEGVELRSMRGGKIVAYEPLD